MSIWSTNGNFTQIMNDSMSRISWLNKTLVSMFILFLPLIVIVYYGYKLSSKIEDNGAFVLKIMLIVFARAPILFAFYLLVDVLLMASMWSRLNEMELSSTPVPGHEHINKRFSILKVQLGCEFALVIVMVIFGLLESFKSSIPMQIPVLAFFTAPFAYFLLLDIVEWQFSQAEQKSFWKKYFISDDTAVKKWL